MIRYFTLVLFLIITVLSHGQRPGGGEWGKKNGDASSITGRITGDIIDAQSNLPVEFATVLVLSADENKQIDGTISDEKGHFKFPALKLGKYNLEISFIGYTTQILGPFELTKEKPDVRLNKTKLLPDGVTLDEVMVTAEANIIENRIDKLVYNVDKDASLAGGDATDVLRKVPMLSVDLEGNVSLRGSQNLRILINGRPSGMFADNVAEALQVFPADQIKSVEVITSPTAKYDGEGSAGIINLVTHKKNVEGFTGTVNAGIGTRRNNGVFSINAGKGRFGFNTNASISSSWPRDGGNSFYREDYYDGNLRIVDQNGETESIWTGMRGSAGAYYDINAYNYISTNLNFRGRKFVREGFTDVEYLDPAAGIEDLYTRYSDNDNFRNGFSWITDYRRTFNNPDQELVIGYQLDGNVSNSKIIYDQTSEDPLLVLDELSENDGLNLESIGQIDYTHPFLDRLKLETGIKGTLRNIDSDYTYDVKNFTTGEYNRDTDRSNKFNYKQNVYAAYGSFNIELGEKYTILAGGRYEVTDISGDFESSEFKFTNDYGNFLPSFIISKKLQKFQTLKLSYTKRIQRPGLRNINPYIDQSDRLNISYGNPELSPEITNQVELSYGNFFEGTSINIATYYKHSNEVIERFTFVNEDGVSETTYLNIGENNSIGLNVFASTKVSDFLEFRGGFNVWSYNVESSMDADLTNDGFQYNGNLSATLNISDGLKAEVSGFWRSRRLTVQGKIPSFSRYSMGVKQKILKERGTIGITIVQPFTKEKSFNSELTGENFYQFSSFTIPFRSFGLNFSYQFGNLEFKDKKRRTKIRNDDQKQGEESNF